MDDGLFVKRGEDFKFNCVIVVTKASEYCRWYVLVVKLWERSIYKHYPISKT